jgi:isoquinoline 1-oxidoreductase subunit alpha
LDLFLQLQDFPAPQQRSQDARFNMPFLLKVNGAQHQVDAEPDTPLLWILREELGLTGTKFGCGIGICGACTVHFNGTAVRSCMMPVAAATDGLITTIETLENDRLSSLQQAWIELEVPQCGYCQAGVLMAAAALLAENPRPSKEDIDGAITNLCRCGTYQRIRQAIHRVVK